MTYQKPTPFDVDEFWRIKKETPESVEIFNSFDKLIMAAYDYAKITKLKAINFDLPKSLLLGFKFSDNKYFMGRVIPMNGGGHILHDQLREHNVSHIDFINKQLVMFL